MRLFLSGHDYKYAVEQIMLSLFPQERPEYGSGGSAPPVATSGPAADSPPAPPALSAESRLSIGGVYAQAATVIRRGGAVSSGVSRVRRSRLADRLAADRHLQRIIKQSFYKAAMAFVDSPPVWGSLTGIRPARIAAKALSSGMSGGAAAKRLIGEYHVSPERAEICAEAAQSALHVKQSLEPNDVALYIGIPFCPSRCAYCSFVSNSVEKSFGLVEPFVRALLDEIAAVSGLLRDFGLRPVAVYFGGGTPTALPDGDFEAVLSALGGSFDLAGIREYTIEAGRPDTITGSKLEIMGRFGVRRLCVNPQSMSDDVLKLIGRRHTAEDAAAAARLVRRCGMALNMDVIAGLPGDGPEGFGRTIDAVLGLDPENITVHTLSLKKGSRIMLEDSARPGGADVAAMPGGADVAARPGGADVAAMLDYAFGRLRGGGFRPYYLYRQKFASGGFENTGWCLPGHEGLYNICMMEELCTVVSLGGGAVTKLVSPGGRIERLFNAKYPREYILKANELPGKIEKIREFYNCSEPHAEIL